MLNYIWSIVFLLPFIVQQSLCASAPYYQPINEENSYKSRLKRQHFNYEPGHLGDGYIGNEHLFYPHSYGKYEHGHGGYHHHNGNDDLGHVIAEVLSIVPGVVNELFGQNHHEYHKLHADGFYGPGYHKKPGGILGGVLTSILTGTFDA